MINKDLYIFLRDTTPGMKAFPKTCSRKITPTTEACHFLEEGCIMEYYTMKDGRKKVSWFWTERGFIIPSSPYSSVASLVKGRISIILYGGLIRGLKEFEESRTIYQKLRDEQNQRIAERINDIKTLSPFENYIKLLETKPLVFNYVSNEDIASYLNISINEFERFRQNQA